MTKIKIDGVQLSFNGFKIKHENYKNIFIVGKNNIGKTRELKELEKEGIGELVEISKLEERFDRSYESFSKLSLLRNTENKENAEWYDYTRENFYNISKILERSIEIKTDREINSELEDGKKNRAIDNFRIDNSIFSSTGYISLFLLCSLLLFYEVKEPILQKIILLDEIDAFLDLENKQNLPRLIDSMKLKNKLMISTHSPYTILKAKGYLLLDLNKEEIYYTNDIKSLGQLESILIPELKTTYELSEELLFLSKLYKKMILNKNNYLDSNSERKLIDILSKRNSLSYKEQIILNAIEKIRREYR